MKRLELVFVAVVLATIVAGQVLARDGGCCVCADGRCLEQVGGIRACIDRCQPAQPMAYNDGGKCIDKCLRVVERVRREKAEKGARQ